MTNINFKFPLLAFRKGDKNIYFFKTGIGYISKKGQKFYTQLNVIDSDGNVFSLKKAVIKGRASLLISLKYFQPMYEMDLQFQKEGEISHSECQKFILNHIAGNKNHWLVLDTFEGIEQKIKSTTTFSQLFSIFA